MSRLQIDWLDTWFKPRLKVVGYGQFIATVTELESQKARIFSVDVDKAKGQYKISYQPTKQDDKPQGLHEGMAQPTQGAAKRKIRKCLRGLRSDN